jgi:hypothetical protein
MSGDVDHCRICGLSKPAGAPCRTCDAPVDEPLNTAVAGLIEAEHFGDGERAYQLVAAGLLEWPPAAKLETILPRELALERHRAKMAALAPEARAHIEARARELLESEPFETALHEGSEPMRVRQTQESWEYRLAHDPVYHSPAWSTGAGEGPPPRPGTPVKTIVAGAIGLVSILLVAVNEPSGGAEWGGTPFFVPLAFVSIVGTVIGLVTWQVRLSNSHPAAWEKKQARRRDEARRAQCTVCRAMNWLDVPAQGNTHRYHCWNCGRQALVPGYAPRQDAGAGALVVAGLIGYEVGKGKQGDDPSKLRPDFRSRA